jgi:hypothetical protein
LVIAESIISWRAVHFRPEEIADGSADDGADADGDGFSNRAEYTLGTDPCAFTPQPLVITPAAGNQFTLSFVARSATGAGYAGLTRRYAVEASADLTDPDSWQVLSGHTNIIGDGSTIEISVTGDAPRKFHRLKVRLE